MPTIHIKHSSGEPTLMAPLGAPRGATNGPPKSKFIETNRVGCLSLRLNTIHMKHSCGEPTPMGTPQPIGWGPHWGRFAICKHPPHSTHRNTQYTIQFVWYQSNRLGAHSSFTAFMCRIEHQWVSGVPSTGALGTLGTYSTSVLVRLGA